MDIGIIGLSLSHPVTYAKLFPSHGARVGYVWDYDARAAQRFVDTFGGRVVSVPEEMASLPVDAVFVTSRTADHCRHARPAVDAGKPVYVNKPLDVDAAAAADLISLAKRRGGVFMSCTQQRYNPSYRALASMVADGALGDIVYARAFAGHQIRSYIDSGDWQDDPMIGGGTAINMGIHAVEPLVAVLAQAGVAPQWVTCSPTRRIYKDTRSEDVASYQIGFQGDLVAAADVVCSAGMSGYALEIYGTKATYHARANDWLSEWKGGVVPVEKTPNARDHMLSLFFSAIATGESPIPFDETLAITQTLAAGRRSADLGGERITL